MQFVRTSCTGVCIGVRSTYKPAAIENCFQKKRFSVYLSSLWPILIVFNRIDRKRKEFEGIFKE